MSDCDASCQTRGSARERLLCAALRMLFERGYRGATSRAIACAAEVNEVTLFRLFSTKDDLLAEAIVHRAEADRKLLPAPTGNLQADLEQIARIAVHSLARGALLFSRVLPEVARLPEAQQARARAALHATEEELIAPLRHYQRLGLLNAEVGDRIWSRFTAPIFSAVLHAEYHQEPLEFDVSQHVQLFLHGCATHPQT